MKLTVAFILLSLIILLSSLTTVSKFKSTQIKFERVNKAFLNTEERLSRTLMSKDIDKDNFEIIIYTFKSEKRLEVFGRNKGDSNLRFLLSYEMCELSGQMGPKRAQGDLQTPEGFYFIDRFNPLSNFHLSLGINYPNTSDKYHCKTNKPGGDIFIHGECLTVGCIPITNKWIEELYTLCVIAKDSGQDRIPVIIFPKKLSTDNYKALSSTVDSSSEKAMLWNELYNYYQKAYRNGIIAEVKFLENGRHEFGFL